jgi:hypothetical protein
MPHVPTYLPGISVIVDVENMKAAIPGEGDTPIVFTYTTDVANFVAASLELPKWPQRSVIVGDKITANQLVALIEKVRGKVYQYIYGSHIEDLRSNPRGIGRKMDIVHDSVQDLKAGRNTELPSNIPRYVFFPKPVLEGLVQVFGMAIEEGLFDIKGKVLNDMLPDVKPMSVNDFLQTYWGGK